MRAHSRIMCASGKDESEEHWETHVDYICNIIKMEISMEMLVLINYGW